jgi:hypothetical protein
MEKKEEEKYKLELGFNELCLIERALELYGRVGMLQFDYLTICTGLQKLIWEKKLGDDFREKADGLKSIFGYSPNANPGIFNKEMVSDDSRIAIDMYQTIRHQRYLDRLKTDPDESKHHGVHKYPADICKIAGIKTPIFKFVEDEEDK